MFLPQFLDYLRHLHWYRSSFKTKACKFFNIFRFADAVPRPADPLAPLGATFLADLYTCGLTAQIAKSSALLSEINSFPVLDSMMITYPESLRCFSETQFLSPHRLYHQLLKLWRIAFARFPFWRNNAPHLFSVYYTV